MTEKKRDLKKTEAEWIDPDDAPELTGEWFDKADLYHGETLIRRGRPKLETPKVSTTLRLDADVIAQFKAKGPKWQTRINDALRAWLKQAG
jgi:uncharacterized protein (DUF4415 family)